MDKGQLEILEKITSILVNLTILTAALVAAIKLQLYNLLERRFRTEFRATHIELGNGAILFEGDYVIHNTGERPIKLSKVDLGLYGVQNIQGQLEINREKEIFRRVITAENTDLEGLFHLQPGERSIFTIRCQLSDLEDMTFIRCQFEWPYKRKSGSYLSLYIRKKGETFAV